MSVTPVPGCGCEPVMAVVALSSTHTVMSWPLYTAFTRQAAAGEERGVAHERQRLLVRLGHGEALRHRDARAHAQAGVHRIERLGVAKRVAADVPAQHSLTAAKRLLHGIEAAAVRQPAHSTGGRTGNGPS